MSGQAVIRMKLFGLFQAILVIIISGNVFASRFYQISNKLLPDSFQQMVTNSINTCCIRCDRNNLCFSVNYRPATGECQLINTGLEDVETKAGDSIEWDVYSKKGWMLVFRGMQDVGKDPYESWVNGDGTTNDTECSRFDVNSCSQHYRNPLVDTWTSYGISEVKFAFYKDSAEVAYILFDGRGTDILSWFEQQRILHSSWPNLKYEVFNHFSIVGHGDRRRFYINTSHNGCQNDPTYTITMTNSPNGCDYEQFDTYPRFFYANTTSAGQLYYGHDMDQADAIAIFIN